MSVQGTGKKATNLWLNQALSKDARALGISVSAAAKVGLEVAVRKAKAAWIEKNRAAIEACNKWVEENGLPLEKHRMFNVWI